MIYVKMKHYATKKSIRIKRKMLEKKRQIVVIFEIKFKKIYLETQTVNKFFLFRIKNKIKKLP